MTASLHRAGSSSHVFTLGPAGTDAAAEAGRLFDHVVLEQSFPEAMTAALAANGLALIAAGFLALDQHNGTMSDTWADLHFRSLQQMALVDVWSSPTKPMALGLNRSCTSIADVRTVALYPATRALAATVVPTAQICPVSSKPEGVRLASEGLVDACIGSVDVIGDHEDVSVALVWQPSMIWALYEPVGAAALGGGDIR